MKQILTSLIDKHNADKTDFIRTLLITEGFGFCVSLSCVLGYNLDHFGSVFSGVWQVIGNLLLTLIATQVLCFVGLVLIDKFLWKQSAVFKVHEDRTIRSIKLRMTEWLVGAAVLILLWLPAYFAYYPAVFSYDAEAQLYQVISGNYSTHHPLLHTLIMGMFMKLGYNGQNINSGMAAYAFCQMIFLGMTISAAIMQPWRLKRRIGRTAIVILELFFGLFPAFSILSVSTTKDIVFSGTVLLMTMFMLDLPVDTVSRNDERIRARGLYAAVGVCVFLLLLFRNNTLYAIALMLIIMLIWRRDKKLMLSLAVAVVLSFIVSFGLKTVTSAEAGSPREALSIPIQQMARVKALYNDELDEDLRSNLAMLISDEWADRYDEHLADPIKERISMKQPVVFVKTWIKLGMKYPGTYIDAWLLTTEGAWYLRDTSCNRIYGEGQITGFGYLSTDIRNMPEGFGVISDSKLPKLQKIYEGIVSDNAFEHIPIVRLVFSPALYFWMFATFIYIQILCKKRESFFSILFLGTYYLTLLLSPAILVRYMLPYMLAAPVLMVSRDDTY